MRSLTLPAIAAGLLLCLSSLAAAQNCPGGVCALPGAIVRGTIDTAGDVVRGTVYRTGEIVRSVPVVRRGLFGRRSYSYRTEVSYGSQGGYGASGASYAPAGAVTRVYYTTESPYAETVTTTAAPEKATTTSTTKTTATGSAASGCQCAEKIAALEARVLELEQALATATVPFGESPADDGAKPIPLGQVGTDLKRLMAERGKPVPGTIPAFAMR